MIAIEKGIPIPVLEKRPPRKRTGRKWISSPINHRNDTILGVASGVYAIKVGGRFVYVGESGKLDHRITLHINDIVSERNLGKKFKDIFAAGEMRFVLLHAVNDSELADSRHGKRKRLSWEQYFIKRLRPVCNTNTHVCRSTPK